jgi:predicted Zn-dependent peptidase
MDFGISRSYAEDVTVTGSVVGTPAYMAPEQAEGRPLDHRTDIYAFGLVLYEMFTGEQAFKGDTAMSVALKQVRERPTEPTALAPALPKHIAAAIMRCVEKDPAARFQSVDEAMRALEGEAASAPRETPRPAHRWRLPVAVASAIVVAIAAGLWITGRSSDSVQFPVEQFTLPNGLLVALSPDHASPTFTLTVAYRAGVRRDTPARRGLAHLVQHATYEGTPNAARGEYKELMSATGGNVDGGTTGDETLFWCTLPANQLDLALFLEADRMRGIAIDEAGLQAARASLLEERARAISSGYQRAVLGLKQLAFDNFANQQSVSPPVEELNAITIDDVRKFHDTYYTPSNAAVVLVGDFDPAKARERIAHYFAALPARPAPPKTDLREPGRSAEKRETSIQAIFPATMVVLAWRAPASTDPEWLHIEHLTEVLGGSGSSRLANELIKTASVATNVQVGLESSAGPNLLTVVMLIAPGKDPAQAERVVYDEIDRIEREGVPREEIERVLTESRRRRAFQMVTTTVRAQVMAQIILGTGRAEGINDWERNTRSATSAEMQGAARKFLTAANRTVLTIAPAAPQRGKP